MPVIVKAHARRFAGGLRMVAETAVFVPIAALGKFRVGTKKVCWRAGG